MSDEFVDQLAQARRAASEREAAAAAARPSSGPVKISSAPEPRDHILPFLAATTRVNSGACLPAYELHRRWTEWREHRCRPCRSYREFVRTLADVLGEDAVERDGDGTYIVPGLTWR